MSDVTNSVSEVLEKKNGELQKELLKLKTENTELQKRANRYKLLFESALSISQDNLFYIDTNGKLTYANDVFLKSIDKTLEEITGTEVLKLFPPEVVPKRKQAVLDVIESGETQNLIDEREGKVFSSLISPVFNENNELETIAIIARDITHEIHTITELEKSESNFKTLIEKLPLGIYLVKDDKFVFGNNLGLKLLDLPSIQELKKLNIYSIIPEKYRDSVKERMNNINQNIQNSTFEIQGHDKNGTLKYVESVSIPISLNDENYALIVINDITEKIKTQRALAENESRFRNYIENSPDGIFQVTDCGICTEFNNSALILTGLNRTELLNKNILNVTSKYLSGQLRIFLDDLNKHNKSHCELNFSIKRQGRKYLIADGIKFGKDKNIVFVKDITTTKIHEEQIRKIFEAVPVPMMLINEDKKIVNVNNVILERFNVTKTEILGKRPGIALNCITSKESFQDCGLNERCNNCTIREKVEYVFKSGNDISNVEAEATFYFDYIKQTMWFNLNVEPIQLNNKRYVLVALSDITKNKEIEKKLAGALSHLRMLVRQLPLVVWTTDRELNFTFSDGAGLADLALKPNEVVTDGLNLYQFFQTTSKKYLPIKKTLEALQGKKSYYEFEFGNSIWECFTEAVLNERNEIIGTFGVALNVTDKKKNEKELDEYRKHLETLVDERTELLKKQFNFLKTFIDTIPNPVFVKDINGRYTEVNKAFAEFFNASKEEIIGNKISNIITGEIVEKTNHVDNELINEHNTRVYETSFNDSEGNEVPVIIYKASFGSHDSKPEGIAGIIVDISERIKMEQQVLKALHREKEHNEMKTNFLSMASHEFRTPLTSILSAAEMLELFGKQWPEEKYYLYLDKIQNSVLKMKDLLEDVISISRTDRGMIKLSIKRNNLLLTLKDIIKEVQLEYNSTQQIIFSFKSHLLFCYFDKEILTHIIHNLLSNAVKYSPGESKIYFTLEVDNQNLIFSIRNKGYGIPEEDLERVFEPFYRSKNSELEKGSGLGLAVVKRYVDLHKGQISIKSELNKYTEFIVKLPFKT